MDVPSRHTNIVFMIFMGNMVYNGLYGNYGIYGYSGY